ncbi:MAG: SMI1/KNR4 family protein [Pirellulales bacterium]
MPLDQFEKHVTDPAPGFRCYNSRDKSAAPAFIARVKNHIGDPATPDAIAIISATCGPAALQLRNFAALHDGVMLYRDRKSEAAGISFFPVAEWKAKTDEMRESMVAMDFDEQEMPDWMQTGVVFGEIPESANYFVIQPSGSEAGHVFYCDHDDFTEVMSNFKCDNFEAESRADFRSC